MNTPKYTLNSRGPGIVAGLSRRVGIALSICGLLTLAACNSESTSSGSATLSDAEVENLVRRSYQYVAMYNVNNKLALKQGGWNTVDADKRPQTVQPLGQDRGLGSGVQTVAQGSQE